MSDKSSEAAETIAFQGAPGAYSDMACREVFADRRTMPCKTFTDAFAAVVDGRARLAMIPIENSVAGRVADIHQLLPESPSIISQCIINCSPARAPKRAG